MAWLPGDRSPDARATGLFAEVDISESKVPAGIDVVELVGVEAEGAVVADGRRRLSHRISFLTSKTAWLYT
jgi:hypothetical protein